MDCHILQCGTVHRQLYIVVHNFLQEQGSVLQAMEQLQCMIFDRLSGAAFIVDISGTSLLSCRIHPQFLVWCYSNQSTKVVITKVIIQNVLLLWLKLEQAKFELFSQKVIT